MDGGKEEWEGGREGRGEKEEGIKGGGRGRSEERKNKYLINTDTYEYIIYITFFYSKWKFFQFFFISKR